MAASWLLCNNKVMWLLMKLSYFNRDMSQICIEQPQRQFRFPKPAVETIAKLIKIFLKISRRNTMKRTIKKFFHVANHDMDKRQPLRSFLRWSKLFLMDMIRCNSIQRWQGIRSNVLARLQMKNEKRLHSFLRNRVKSLHGQKSRHLSPWTLRQQE